jgi:hypothetical protein
MLSSSSVMHAVNASFWHLNFFLNSFHFCCRYIVKGPAPAPGQHVAEPSTSRGRASGRGRGEQPDWGLFGKFQNVALDIVAKKRILHVFANGYAF